MFTYLPPNNRLRVPYTGAATPRFGDVAAKLYPYIWIRCNTASGTENNLGYGGGTVSFGSSGTRNATGGPTPVSGFYTNPASSGASYVRSSLSDLWTTFTCMTFVKLPSTGNSQASHSPQIMARKEYFASAFNSFPFGVSWDETNKKISVGLDSGNDFSGDQTITTDNNSIPVDAWCHLAVVVRPSGSNVEIYLNGSILKTTAATTTVPVLTSGPNWSVGAANEYSGGAGNSECLGDYAEFMVLPRAVSAADIAELYAARGY